MPPATLFRPLPTTRTRRRNRLTTRVGLGCQPDGGQDRALDVARVLQAVSTQAWLELRFEQVQQQDGQPADQLSLLAFAPCSRFPRRCSRCPLWIICRHAEERLARSPR